MIERWSRRLGGASAAPFSEQLGRLLRLMILSQCLPTAEFGAAVIITLVIGMADLATDTSADKFVVLRASDNAWDALAASHLISLARGILLCLTVMLLAGPLARFLGAPDAAAGLAVASLFLLLRGFSHLEIKQIQHDYRFKPDAIASVSAQGFSVLMVGLAALTLADHRAAVVAFLAEGMAYAILSHRLARTRWRLASSLASLKDALGFALPLMANGVGLATLSQADRAIISVRLGLEALALYAVVMSVAISIAAPFIRAMFTLGFSLMVRSREAGSSSQSETALLIAWGSTLAALGYAAALALSLDWLVPLLFGRQYQVDHMVHALVVGIAFVRVSRNASTVFLLAEGRGRALAISNLLGFAGLALALLLSWIWPNPAAVLLGLLIGDLLVELALRLASVRHSPARGALLRQAWFSMGLCLVVTAFQWLWQPAGPQGWLLFLAVLGMLAIIPAWRVLALFRARSAPASAAP